MSEGNDGPCYETTASSSGHTGPQTAMQDTKPTDLQSLEARVDATWNNVKRVKDRLANLLNKIRDIDNGEKQGECIEKAPMNRISRIENVIDRIDNEGGDINQIISQLEEILG